MVYTYSNIEQLILESEYKNTLWCIFNNTVIDLT